MTAEDKGGHLELNITPVIRAIDYDCISNWLVISSETAQYVEVRERWFFELPTEKLLSRFSGINIIFNENQIDIEVDDDIIGAFTISFAK